MNYALVSLENATPGRVAGMLPHDYSIAARLEDLALVIAGRSDLEHVLTTLAAAGITARELDPATALILLKKEH